MYNCVHEMVEYIGLTDRFMNCKLCGAKESELVERELNTAFGALVRINSQLREQCAKVASQMRILDEMKIKIGGDDKPQGLDSEAALKFKDEEEETGLDYDKGPWVSLIVPESRFREIVISTLKAMNGHKYESISDQLLVCLRDAHEEENDDEE